MKQFRVFKISNMWSTSKLTREVEIQLNGLTKAGYEIVSVSFVSNFWSIPTAFITVSKGIVY